jgi:membrane-bound lytic murein transglycosylase D
VPTIRTTIAGLSLLAALPTARGANESAPAEEPATVEDWLDAGRQIWEEHAPAEIKEHFDFPTVAHIEDFLADVQRTLSEGTFPELAAYEPDARRALTALRQFSGGDELADWLEPRLDFLTAARDVTEKGEPEVAVRSRPMRPGETAPPPPSPPPSRSVHRTPFTRPYWDDVVVRKSPPKRAAELVPGLKRIFAAKGVPPKLVWIAEVESSMDPKARSPVGARGLFQFMPATAKQYGLSVTLPDDRTNPEKSAGAAADYLRYLHGRFDSWPLAIAAYNAGEGRVGRTLKSTGTTTFPAVAKHLPSETRLYVPKVMATVAAREGVDPDALPAPRP